MASPTIFKEFANGIRDVKDGRFFPYKTVVSGPGAEVLPQKQNIRYFVKQVVVSVSSLVTDAGTVAGVTGKQYLETVTLCSLVKTTLKVDQVSLVSVPRVLLDKESPLSFTAADITTASVQVTFAEVDDCE